MADDNNQDQKGHRARSAEDFWLHQVFPHAAESFAFRQRPVDAIKGDCLVILDANVLLMPYRLGAHSLGELKAVYQALSDQKRLFVPGQAAREFLKNRGNRVRDIVRELSRQASQIFIPFEKKVGFLDTDADFEEVKKLAIEIGNLKSGIANKLSGIADRLTSEIGADPVSVAYQEIFKGAVFDLELDTEQRAAFAEEMRWRYDHDIPPGYKDDDKIDGGMGDLLIWKTILKLGEERNLDAIFVTEDAKSDWWVQSEGAFQPRIELVEEYCRASKGRTIQLMPLSSLLKLFGAEQVTVDEAKQVEEARRIRERLLADRDRKAQLALAAAIASASEEQIATSELQALLRQNVELSERFQQLSRELSRLRRMLTNERVEILGADELAQLFQRRDALEHEQKVVHGRRRAIEMQIRRLTSGDDAGDA